MKILVTGGSGFIGQHLTKKLIDDGHEVTITSNGSEPKIPGVKKVLYTGLAGIDWFHVENQNVVFHQAANNDTRCTDTEEMRLANITAPCKLFYAAYKGGCKKFIYASSTAVYGNSPAPYIEDQTPIAPETIYAQSKASFDEFAMDFAAAAKVSVIGLRYCNVYGPGEELKGKRMSMIGQMIRTASDPKGVIKLFERGDQKRDWIYIDDVIKANLLAMNRTEIDGRIYNIGSGKSSSFNEIINTLNDTGYFEPITQVNGRLQYIPCPFTEEYQNHTECNIEKAQRELSLYPSFNLRSGIEAYINALNA